MELNHFEMFWAVTSYGMFTLLLPLGLPALLITAVCRLFIRGDAVGAKFVRRLLGIQAGVLVLFVLLLFSDSLGLLAPLLTAGVAIPRTVHYLTEYPRRAALLRVLRLLLILAAALAAFAWLGSRRVFMPY